MDDLKRLALFAEVVRAGSLSAAGRHMGISTSAVSQQLRALEQAHGVTLLHRSTRKIALTEAGARLAEHCQALVDAAARARQQLTLARDAPEGELRLSAPVGFARHVAPALAPLLAEHPGLRLSLLVDDAMIDLIDARIDLALRAGRLADSNWAARRLCSFDFVLCAAPAYLARAGVPQAPGDLPAHQWVGGGRDGTPLAVELNGPAGERAPLRIEPRVMGNNQLSLQQLCAAGLGVMMAVRADIDDDLRAGRLVPVLPGWRGPRIPVWAVTPQRDGQPAKVRHALEAIRRYLLTVPGAVD
ncbi:LysR family transcriptional regulator [Aquincola sp. MAHUQ-54]|uniref:LysR family transcriptional regulator n=1 Tax=Aquincola agrisoli TaxID=3119538 RepID=A0AAW9Q5H0_9BURK